MNVNQDHFSVDFPRIFRLFRIDLSAFTTDTAGQFDVLGHDGDALGVDGAQIGVLKETDLKGREVTPQKMTKN